MDGDLVDEPSVEALAGDVRPEDLDGLLLGGITGSG
jgi:hypothetical protein